VELTSQLTTVHAVKSFYRGIFLFFSLCTLFNTVSSAAHHYTMSEDAGIEPIGQLRLRHWLSDALTTRLDLISIRIDLIRTRLDLIRTRLDIIRDSARSHPHLARSHPHSDRSHPHSARSHPRLG
jgi:hypothetical protein